MRRRREEGTLPYRTSAAMRAASAASSAAAAQGLALPAGDDMEMPMVDGLPGYSAGGVPGTRLDATQTGLQAQGGDCGRG